MESIGPQIPWSTQGVQAFFDNGWWHEAPLYVCSGQQMKKFTDTHLPPLMGCWQMDGLIILCWYHAGYIWSQHLSSELLWARCQVGALEMLLIQLMHSMLSTLHRTKYLRHEALKLLFQCWEAYDSETLPHCAFSTLFNLAKRTTAVFAPEHKLSHTSHLTQRQKNCLVSSNSRVEVNETQHTAK